jgi:hypothetical protein
VCNQHKRKEARDYHSERAKVGSLTCQSQGLQSLYSKEEKANLEKKIGFHVLGIFFSRLRFPGLKHKKQDETLWKGKYY